MSTKYKYLVDKDGKDVVMTDPSKLIRVLDVNGNLIDKKYKPQLTDKQLVEGYK